jgi:RimJ/RimL family protein N-acetyltransferase
MDDEGHRLTGTHRTFTLPDVQAWAGSRADQDDRLDLTIIDRESGEWAGEPAVNDWDEANQSCGFRIALAPGFRDRGIGSEATRLIVDYVFESLPIHRISLEVFAFNPERSASTSASASCARECNATRCGGTASSTTQSP